MFAALLYYSVLTLPLLPESAGLAGPAVGRAVAAGARVVAAGALVDVAPRAAPRGRLLLAVAAPVVEVGVTLTQRRACNKVRFTSAASSGHKADSVLKVDPNAKTLKYPISDNPIKCTSDLYIMILLCLLDTTL